jgi:hypothetical protein
MVHVECVIEIYNFYLKTLIIMLKIFKEQFLYSSLWLSVQQ